MHSFYRLALLALPLVGTVYGHVPKATPTKDTKPVYANANQAFQDLLNALPEESLHVALNSLTNFKDGVFESDRHGVEHVHNRDPPLATKLIVAAVQDLRKRQTPSNGTATSAPPPPASSAEESQAPSSEAPPPASSQDSAVVVPVPITTTNEQGQATVVSSEILSQPTASVVVAVTTTDEKGSTFVASQTKPAVIFTATDSAGSTFVTTSAVPFAPTPGQVLTTTDARGSTVLTTYTPGGGKVSSILLITTTGADGQRSVITSYTYVDPAAATGPNGQPISSATNSAKPGLQTNAANKNLVIDAAVVGGAALAFWI
ncbi:hypothetical protein BDV96DRAFT_149317 [Lophiotrema nucula]|uniref:Uncharacterized protein n=1 Tax=Lophiotrema nucula TaxID=690887 RepID=A0A6A5Z3P4_9PLEO|nr:hypothetical protein BDV96DRAFT_149317 [Lophiotrema nucula]